MACAGLTHPHGGNSTRENPSLMVIRAVDRNPAGLNMATGATVAERRTGVCAVRVPVPVL
jgi:hypothetical protein